MENTLAHASQRRPMQRLLAIVVALVLAMGLMPHAAWADDAKGDGHTIDASLILVHGIDYNGPKVLVNKHYTLVKGATVADLFQAAKDAGDIKDYKFGGSYIDSVTLNDGTVLSNKADWSSWWSNYLNGESSNGSTCKKGDAVSAGDALEFAYVDAVAYGNPTADQWNALAKKAEDSKGLDSSKPAATLTLVKGINYEGPIVLLNKKYNVAEGATVADLFKAAKDAGDIKDYEFKDAGHGSYIASVTFADDKAIKLAGATVLANKTDWSSSWSNYLNGESSNGSTCKEGDAVSAGDALEFAYADAVSYGNPTADQWNALAGTATVVKPATAAASKYDAATAQSLIANLSARYAQGGKDASISNDTVRAAIALNALGLGASIDADAIVSNMENYKSWDGKSTVIPAGTLGKYIMALTAAGIDCTSVKLSDGKAHNLVSEMEQKVDASALDVYSAVWVLAVYHYGSYTAGADAPMTEGDLIQLIASNANAEGLIMGDTQTTAQAIQALQPYAATNATAKSAIDAAVAGLRSYQNGDGGFGYSSYSVSSLESNIDATADIACALEALGYDCAKDFATANGSTPLSFLESKADADLCGYLSSSNYNEAMTSAGVLAAFVAQANSNGGAYNLYTLNKVSHADDANVSADSDKAPAGTDAQALAQTGDSSAAAALALCAIAGAAGIVASRRKVFAQVELSSETESKVTK